MHEYLELIIAVVTAFVAIIGVSGSVIRFMQRRITSRDEEIKDLKSKIDEKEKSLEELRRKKEFEIEALQRKVDPSLQVKLEDTQKQLEECRLSNLELKDDLIKVHDQLKDHHGKLVGSESKYEQMKSTAQKNATTAQKNATIAKKNYEAFKHLEKEIRKNKSELEMKLRARDEFWEKELEEEKDKSNDEVKKISQERDRLIKQIGEKINEGESQLKKIQELDEIVTTLRQRDSLILSGKGRIWERQAFEEVPPFIPLSNRKTPIISILNLKGGVGKTTLTANLAASLSHPDHNRRTLVIDLDYQRSLTQLCCTGEEVRKLHEREICIQHFFLFREPKHQDDQRLVLANSLQTGDGFHVKPILPMRLYNSIADVRRKKDPIFKIIACSEMRKSDEVSSSLDDTEMHLFAQWLLGNCQTDLRYKLRKALHSETFQNKFDYILLDCPPRLSLACINALSASDFVLIPVILDETSSVSVPLLLKKIKRLKKIASLVSSLKVLGIVANKVSFYRGNQLINHQEAVWNVIPNLSEFAWGEPVYCFNSMIPHNGAFGKAASQREPEFATMVDKGIRDCFSALISEIETRF